ncbi:MAG: hypothetical protein J6A62_08605 [Oscillospiraceae bacterium]|nr:hypothetical protein [Oscillospiraceae bacterium]
MDLSKIPRLEDPLQNGVKDIEQFISCVELACLSGSMRSRDYTLAVGKAIAYTECRYSAGLISTEDAKYVLALACTSLTSTF